MKIGAGILFVLASAVIFPVGCGRGTQDLSEAPKPETPSPMFQKMGDPVEAHYSNDGKWPMENWHRNQFCIGCWMTEEILVTAIRKNCVQAFDTVVRKELWHREFSSNVLSVTASDHHVFVAVGDHIPADGVARLDVLTGEETTPANTPKPFPCATLSWSAEMNALWVLHRGAIWKYSSDFVSLAPEISGCGSPFPKSSPHVLCAGGLILVAERSGLAHLVDPEKRMVRKIAKATMDSGIDSGSLRNAFVAADGRLIWVTDNGWNMGEIYFQSGPDAPETEWLGDLQGRPVAAVHWRSERFAVTGNAGGLSVFSTEGNILQQMVNAIPGGAGCLVFSPSGQKLAAVTDKGIQFYEWK
ncbi:MAG: hypothetical protein EOP86_13825 [Verrucomicrobiaceae bacterium]|nr:MAG: hypothetical protein EOP86_13825 [Verrucomicrobiaceae bacterium]